MKRTLEYCWELIDDEGAVMVFYVEGVGVTIVQLYGVQF